MEAVRNTDPKAVQERVTTQAKEAQATVQAKVTEVFGALDTDLKKWGETAQDLALRSVGVAAEYAVRARETYEKVAERGEQSVRTWRGETAGEIVEIAAVVEAEPKAVPKQKSETVAKPAAKPVTPAKAGRLREAGDGREARGPRREEARAEGRRVQDRARPGGEEARARAQARGEEDDPALREVSTRAGIAGRTGRAPFGVPGSLSRYLGREALHPLTRRCSPCCSKHSARSSSCYTWPCSSWPWSRWSSP